MSKEQIEEMAAYICLVKHNCNDVCNPINTCNALKYARRAYEAGYRKQEWISVKDDTPKDGEKRVQVFLRDDAFTKPIGENKIDTDRFIDGKWVRWGKYVTHWMPLPEPPKGE